MPMSNRWNKRNDFTLRKTRRARRAHKLAFMLANLQPLEDR